MLVHDDTDLDTTVEHRALMEELGQLREGARILARHLQKELEN